MSPQITSLLMLRGAGIPPVRWDEHPNAMASSTLEGLEDEKLFGRAELADQAAASAVRALLYLWNGWMAEATMIAASAGPKEQLYINGLVERHMGRPDTAKTNFQQMEGHDIYAPLTESVAKLTGSCNDKQIKRFADIVQLNDAWEAFAFIDLVEEARGDQLTNASERIVRQLQKQEFDLLIRYCFDQAVGPDAEEEEKTSQRGDESAPRRRRETKRPSSTTNSRSTPSRSAPETKSRPKPDLNSDVRIGCPKCKHLHTLPPSARGQKHKCDKCKVAFMVPGGKGSASAAPDGVRVGCPKCKTTGVYPESKRGEKVACSKCKAVFVVPKRAA